MTITVFGAAYSTYTRSVLIALREKDAAYELSEVDIFKPLPPEHMARMPWGKIPVLDHDGFMLYETAAIERYVDESLKGTALQPTSARDRARMMQVIGIVDSYAYKPTVMGLFVQRAAMPKMGHPSDEETIKAALPEVEKAFDAILKVKGQGRWVAGDGFSLADLHLAPVVAYLMQTPEGQAIAKARPALTAWWAEASRRPSVVQTKSPLEG
ncbi:MAG TPA: glutathione S-transferase family protein [Lichenihabitans sp.]|jgi:glutathione S-transferase|nr:glutathione S-transferase family protein [Lichenihabitans sp.]